MNYKVRFLPQEHLGPQGLGTLHRQTLTPARPLPLHRDGARLDLASHRDQPRQGPAAHRHRRPDADRRHPADPAGRRRAVVDPDAAQRRRPSSPRWSSGRSGGSITPNAPHLIPGRPGLVVAALYGLGSITFITAVYNTSTANLVFILAFNTMFAALLSWIFLKREAAAGDAGRHGGHDRRRSHHRRRFGRQRAICSATSWRCARPS